MTTPIILANSLFVASVLSPAPVLVLRISTLLECYVVKTESQYTPVPNWTWDIPISSKARELYARLLWQADKDGNCRVVNATIQQWVHLHRRRVQQLLTELGIHGLIVPGRGKYVWTYKLARSLAERDAHKSAHLDESRCAQKCASEGSRRAQKCASDAHKSAHLELPDGPETCPARVYPRASRAREHFLTNTIHKKQKTVAAAAADMGTTCSPPPPLFFSPSTSEPKPEKNLVVDAEIVEVSPTALMREVEQICTAMRRFVPAQPEAARALFQRCRERAPDCTGDDVCRAIAEKGPAASHADRNPVGLLMTVVPSCFDGNWRERLAAPPPPPDMRSARDRRNAEEMTQTATKLFERHMRIEQERRRKS